MYKIYKFDNGLKLFYAKNKINKSTAIDVSFCCGAQADGEIAGLSHFCEHMFFTGTKTETKAEISKQYFDFIKVNAYTNCSEICWTGEIFTSELGAYLDMITKLITKSSFDKKAVEDEKKVVVQEIVRDSDNFYAKANRCFSYLLYNQNYYKYGVLGNEKTVNSIKSKDVKDYVKKYFVANNCSVYIASPLSFLCVKKLIQEHLVNKLPVNLKVDTFPIDEYGLLDKSQVLVKKAKIDKNYLKIAFKLPHEGYDYKKSLILKELCNILGDVSDGVTKELRLKNNLVYYADVYFKINQTDYSFVISTEVSSQNIKKCIDVFASYISALLKNGINKELLDKEKRQDKYYFESRIMKPGNYIDELCFERRYKKPITSKYTHKLVQAVSLDDLNNTLHKIFDNPVFSCMVYGNAEKQDVYSLNELKDIFNNL